MKRIISAILVAVLLCGGILALHACGTGAGDTIRFGGMRWRVLEVQNSRALLISEEIIGQRAYHDEFEAVTWEGSDIRRWLNDAFYKQFAERDRARIAQTHVVNSDNPWYGTPGGNDTTDYIFLLSLEEAERYFYGDSEPLRRGPLEPGVEYRFTYSQPPIEARIAHWDGKAESWCLRSPGQYENAAALVLNIGTLEVGGTSYPGVIGIRPALWLEL